MDWVHLLGHLSGRTKVKSGLIEIFLAVDELKAWKGVRREEKEEEEGGRTGFCKNIFAPLWRRSVATEEGGENVWGLARLLPELLAGMQCRQDQAAECKTVQQWGVGPAWLGWYWPDIEVHPSLHSSLLPLSLCTLCPLCTLHCTQYRACSAQRPACNVQLSSVHFAVSSQETWVVPAQTSRQPRLPQVQSAIINICTHYRWWVWGLTRCTWIQIIQKPSIHRRCSGVVGLLSTIFCSRPQLTVQPEQSHSKASI